MKKFAVILCGCGSLDGSEIHESVMTLLAIDRNECTYSIFAPNDNQYHVVNHCTKEATQEKRNMMVEAARIARGDIRPIEECRVEDFDALVFPGGNGAAKNLFTYAFDGKNCTVREDVAQLIKAFHAQHKPIGALCIAPVMIAKVLGDVTITVGNDEGTIANVLSFGSQHINTQQTGVIADKQNMVFTTPCYMLPARISDIADCAQNLIDAILENMQ
ncbi:MAG: isoprenoid biosynthesis glyoxalase ElbB [Bacteroidales bacterium]|jgi:enhancing lycopene biosynthesis protein 2|nr:isoprenoid biosynthesis glyoxalase ElbB [Bacteroidales bacterium]MBR0304868.1 isoprenoid biosynthesis glyoxalase ElbB [Bacteroidales bacterium]